MADEDEFFHTGQVAKGTILGLIGTFFVKIVSFIYSVYIAHAFAQEDIGVFFLSISIVGLFGAWRDLGLPAALARYVPYFESRHQAGKIRSLLFSAFAINIATGILMSVPVYLAADYVGELYNSAALPDALRMMAAFMLVESLSKVCTSYLQSRADIKSGQLVSNVQSVAKLLITFALFSLFGAGLSALIGGYILSFLLSVAVAIPIVIRRTRDLQGSPAGLPTRSLISEIIPFGIMLSIVQLLWTLISYTDKVLLGYLSPLGEAERVVAIYSLATTLALNVMVFPGAVGAIFLPLISRLVGKGDFTGMRRMVGAGVRWVLLITLPVSVVMAVYATEMLSGFYGGSYADGGPAMAIFVLGMIISCFSYATMLALAAMRLVSLEFKVALFAGLLNVALCFLFIPPLGMVGAALSSSLSLLASMLLFLHYGYSVLKFRIPASAIRMGLAGVATALLLLLTKPAFLSVPSLLPKIGGEVGVYADRVSYLGFLGLVTAVSYGLFFALSLLLKCFAREDLDVLGKTAAKAKIPKGVFGTAEKILSSGIGEGE